MTTPAAETGMEPVFEGVAKRKLDDLIARGWEISGYSITKDGEHGLVTTGAFVGWWTVADRNAVAALSLAQSLKAELEAAEDFASQLITGVNAAEAERDAAEASLALANARIEELTNALRPILADLDKIESGYSRNLPDGLSPGISQPFSVWRAIRSAVDDALTKENCNG